METIIQPILILFGLCVLTNTANIFTIMNKLKDEVTLLTVDELTKTREERVDWLYYQLHIVLPGWLSTFVGQEGIEFIINFWYSKVLDYLDDQQFNDSIK